MRLKVSSAKWGPFCLGLNVLIHYISCRYFWWRQFRQTATMIVTGKAQMSLIVKISTFVFAIIVSWTSCSKDWKKIIVTSYNLRFGRYCSLIIIRENYHSDEKICYAPDLSNCSPLWLRKVLCVTSQWNMSIKIMSVNAVILTSTWWRHQMETFSA